MIARIKVWFGKHTSGTKAYQVFAITCDGKAGAVQVNHWGAYDSSSIFLPSDTGQSKILIRSHSEVEWECSRTRSGKGKPHGEDRGYYSFDPPFEATFESPADFKDALERRFKPKDAQRIYDEIMPSPAASAVAAEPKADFGPHESHVESEAASVSETSPDAPFAERPEEWASW